ncbi:MAG: hypothetical protein QOF08_1044 [Gaiellales bacterium]|nr:hypothetical protein [Gaiellales bacterium]
MDRRQAFDLAYLACAALFIFGLMQLASPRTAVRGDASCISPKMNSAAQAR